MQKNKTEKLKFIQNLYLLKLKYYFQTWQKISQSLSLSELDELADLALYDFWTRCLFFCLRATCCLSSSDSLSDESELLWLAASDCPPPPYLLFGPPLIIATLPDLTLLFSSKVSLTLALFLLATSAVFVDSNPC